MRPQDAALLDAVLAGLQGPPPERLGVAVSGGGDSVALLHLLCRCFQPGQVSIEAATVDHGLRPEAEAEAAQVGRLAQGLGIPHSVLHWRDRPAEGNLSDNARRARYRLLAGWAEGRGIGTVMLGHTADDQAETVLMRLARAAGVDGLAAMQVSRTQHGITFLRPLLKVSRADLRGYLVRNGVAWVEDPTNADDRYERVRARHALEHLDPLGISAKELGEVAENMGRAREALDRYALLSAREIADVAGGAVSFDVQRLQALPEEIARRMIVAAIRWIGGEGYPPRRAPVGAMVAAARSGGSTTLAGCRLIAHRGRAWICREYEAVRAVRAPAGGLWDGRWRLAGQFVDPGWDIRALGPEGLAKVVDWRATGLPRAVLLASPALWSGDELRAAPLAGFGQGVVATLEGATEGYYATILSH